MLAPVTIPISPPRAWAEIDLHALRRNLHCVQKRTGLPVMAVVKAGAYGHGLEEVARTLALENGVEFFGVANVGEARRIRAAGVNTPLYLLGATWAEEREEIVARRWVPCLSSINDAQHFNALAAAAHHRLTVHLAVDTGMGRGGFLATELPAILPYLEKLPNLHIEGLGSHLPSADEDRAFTQEQLASFHQVATCTGGTARWRWLHIANSAGLLGYPTGICNLVRPGLVLYGISPFPEDQAAFQPVMTLKARITLIRELPAGHGVSYGRTFITSRPTRVATLGIGYADGYPRHLSGQNAWVMLHGKPAAVLGRVTMDQIMVDVTEIPDAQPGDAAEIFGPNVPLADLAPRAGTIPWEMLTRITARVARIHSGT